VSTFITVFKHNDLTCANKSQFLNSISAQTVIHSLKLTVKHLQQMSNES